MTAAFRKTMNYAGQRFGKLVAVARNKEEGYWDLQCDCGKTIANVYWRLFVYHRRSCDCLKIRVAPEERAIKALIGDYSRQNKRGYAWELTKEQAIALFKGNCVYCNSPPLRELWSKDKNRRLLFKYNGIDRVNNDIGYTSENCVSSCYTCNRGKQDLTIQEFSSWLMAIAENVQ